MLPSATKPTEPRHATSSTPGTARHPLHLIQRGHNCQRCFINDADYVTYLGLLREHGLMTSCKLHAYVLMSNHGRLLLTIHDAAALSGMMKPSAQHYAQYFNCRYQRTGSVWEGRYKTCMVQTEDYFLECQRYIELNPVRAGMVAFPSHYRWSSYRGNAEGRRDGMTMPHDLYQRLGLTDAERRQTYQRLFDAPLSQYRLVQIRAAINSQRAL
ncbi:transposase [Duganella sp. 3397]|uniref:transposase n=1 Tax=Duganella sp. 3397 TaxID=2817732 RepID=UPI00286D4018|nr:transposase [Duganella sp. 3397]